MGRRMVVKGFSVTNSPVPTAQASAPCLYQTTHLSLPALSVTLCLVSRAQLHPGPANLLLPPR